MNVQHRKTWKNHLGNQAIQPLRLYAPESLDDVVALVREAERSRCTVRAVGSGHSWSDVALTPGFLVDTSGLSQILDLEPQLLRSGVDAARLVRAEAGIRLRELNAHLDAHGLALSNMGGYDGQTVAGVISTSTHGSGIGFGPFASITWLTVLALAGRGEFSAGVIAAFVLAVVPSYVDKPAYTDWQPVIFGTFAVLASLAQGGALPGAAWLRRSAERNAERSVHSPVRERRRLSITGAQA